jgi:hypothetical protein
MTFACSPSKQEDYSKYTCYTKNQLLIIVNIINSKEGTELISPNLEEPYLVSKLEKYFKSCDNQYCWIEKLQKIKHDHDFISFKKRFRPFGPKNSTSWLSTIDINKVLTQYEEKYNDFYYMGAVPVDFELLYSKFKNISLYKLYYQKKKKKLGVVINLDTHDKDGSHWVALFIDLCKGDVYYNDSIANQPPKEVVEFVNKISTQHKSITLHINNKKEQNGNTECGVFSMYFIINMLNDANFFFKRQNDVNDKTMVKCRKSYFNEKK